MEEIVPIVAGALTAAIALRFASTRTRIAVVIGLSILFGLLASLISGELATSWVFVLFDISFVLIAALIVWGAFYLWQQRGARMTSRR